RASGSRPCRPLPCRRGSGGGWVVCNVRNRDGAADADPLFGLNFVLVLPGTGPGGGRFPMSENPIDLTAMVEGRDGISVVRSSPNCRDWNGIHYKVGMSRKNVGATRLSMNVATIPPGGVARAHIHVDFELMLYIMQGRVRHEYGDGLM